MGSKSNMAIALCDINVEALLKIARRLLQYSDKINSYSFKLKTIHETFQKMLKQGNPYNRFEDTLCIRFIDIQPEVKVTKIHIEIILNSK